MVASDEGTNESLKFCLEGTKHNIIDWGHEYLRSLSGEVGREYNKRIGNNLDISDLMFLVDIIAPFFMKHNEEPEAVDLLMEVESLEKLISYSSPNNFERVCMYLLSCACYAADPEEMMQAFKTAY
jgi:26S proteasome regulatory subunit N1